MKALIATLLTAFAVSVSAAPSGKLEEVKKPEQTTAVPATPKSMPKVEKPKDKRNIDCKKEENKKKLKCVEAEKK